MRENFDEEFVSSCLDVDRVDTVRAMLENGANPESEYNGSSALMVARFSGNYQVVKMLIEYGVRLDQRNQEVDGGEGVVFVAAKNNQVEVLRVLLDHMAPLLPDRDELTPYQIAFKLNHFECAKMISDYMKSIH